MGKSFKNRNNKISFVINEKIRAREVRVTGEGLDSEVLPIKEAIALAESMDKDLIMINANTSPAICKIAEYDKFLYETKKRAKEQESGTKKVELKEIRLTPNTDDNDLEFKSRHGIAFLERGNKVKVSLLFKGREITHKERGEIMLLKMATKLEEVGIVEVMPKLDGKRMFMIINPKKKK